VSSAVHGALYVLLLAMPVVGYIANSAYGAPTPFFGLFTLPKLVANNEALATQLFTLHRWAGFLVILLAGMHIGAALFHYVIHRDTVLQRMLPRALGGS
jgi:cytochrome b561